MIVKLSNVYSTGYATFMDLAKYVFSCWLDLKYVYCVVLWHIAAGYAVLDV